MTPFELFLIGTLAVVVLLLVALLLRPARLPESAQGQLGELLRRQDTQDALLAKIEGQVQMLAGAQEARLASLSQGTLQALENVRDSVDRKLAAIQADNATKLEAMRQTVSEKLQATLEARLGQSFELVSKRLEEVHRGLGEMQSLAAGVGDLKRVLGNVKTRGVWGEVQLDALMSQILAPEQYAKNVATRPNAAERVEFAVRLPGQGSTPVWLPIDAKFPLEDYQRLLDAHEAADLEAAEAAARALEARLKLEAKTIREKYLEPPFTTDFAVLYLPTEGLYAEALRRPGLAEALQRDQRVTLAGPTTIAAFLNSLQLGFRTLAIEARAHEVWQVLGEVKTEFGKFGAVIEATKKKLDEARNKFDQVDTRRQVLERRLRKVEALPVAEEAAALPDLAED
ncbi:MAG: DNA recombination protein RmuC [Rhodocyclaceae bacterium]|nr:DNA recombination protein RmuC [Rhodocyclaceae bacterium]